jgi:hypothetical protein
MWHPPMQDRYFHAKARRREEEKKDFIDTMTLRLCAFA